MCAPQADAELQAAAFAIVLAALVAGALWAGAVAVTARLGDRRRVLRESSLGFRWRSPSRWRSPLAAATLDDPMGKVRDEYRAFTELGAQSDSSSRFTSGGGNRYDYWRVAVDQFADHPLRGVGAGNYDRTYFLERRTTEDIRQPHSIELQTLGELGIVGGALLAIFLVAIAVGFARRAREARERSLAPAV